MDSENVEYSAEKNLMVLYIVFVPFVWYNNNKIVYAQSIGFRSGLVWPIITNQSLDLI